MAKPDNLSSKKRTYASNAVLYAFFVIGAIALVNVIATRISAVRVDLTEAKMYTISPGSKELVKKLPDFLTVKAFLSNDLPPELKSAARYVRDMLDEYKNASDGKLRWEAIDPGEDKKLEEEASRCRVEKLQIQVMRSSKFELGNHYVGLCFQYADQIESIPQVARVEGLEYQITSLIKKMTQKKRKIAFTTGHGEADNSQGFQALREDLQKEYDVTTVNPSSAEIGADVDALIVGGPKQAFDEKGQRELDKFAMRGKGLIFLVDGMAMQAPNGGQQFGNPQIEMGQANETGLGKVLEAYGFKVGQDFVFDQANVPGPLDVGGRTMLANIPVYVGAAMDEHKDLSVIAGLRGAVFPYPSSVDLVGPLKDARAGKEGKDEKLANGGKLWRLATSSEESWKHTGFFVLTPTQKWEPSGDRGPFALGYAYEGKLKSAFPPGAEAAITDPSKGGAPKAESEKPVRLLVMGDSDFANDRWVSLAGRHPLLNIYASGAQLLFNAIGWAVEDETLAPLRSKTLMPRPIKVSSDGVALAAQWGNIVGIPLAFCLFGVLRWRVRRARRGSQSL